MCIIIDANKAGDFCQMKNPYMKKLVEWVGKGGKIAHGGPLVKELYKLNEIRNLVITWERQGSLIKIDNEKIKTREKEIKEKFKHNNMKLRSNDAHVIALAIESRARIVVTEDKKLIKDLKNRKLVGDKIKIYKEPRNPKRIKPHKDMHKRMLEKSDCP